MKLFIAVALTAVVLVAAVVTCDSNNEAATAEYNAAEKAYTSVEKAYAEAQKNYTITQEEFTNAGIDVMGTASFDDVFAVAKKALQAAGDALAAANRELWDANTARINAFTAIADEAEAKEFADTSKAHVEAFIAEVEAEAKAELDAWAAGQ